MKRCAWILGLAFMCGAADAASDPECYQKCMRAACRNACENADKTPTACRACLDAYDLVCVEQCKPAPSPPPPSNLACETTRE